MLTTPKTTLTRESEIGTEGEGSVYPGLCRPKEVFTTDGNVEM
jgi:hypothetical protein